MNEDTIADLKQFIAATVRQELFSVKDELKKDIGRVEKKVDDMALGIGDAIESLAESVEGRLDNHETRITKLEGHPV